MTVTKNIYLPVAALLVLCFASCSKITAKKPGTIDTTIIVPVDSSGTNTGPAHIKFFNTLYDYNAMTCFLNGASVANVSDFYPSGYITALAGKNEVRLYYPTTATTVLDVNVTLTGGGYYSCFLYKAGYDWKVSVVNDNLTLPSAGYFKVRILDFRTQAYFDNVKTRIYYPGNVTELDQTGRHFLDHTSFDNYTKFDSLPSGKYNVLIYNDTATLARKLDYNFVPRKIYSVVLTTASNQSAAVALFKIQTDIEVHN